MNIVNSILPIIVLLVMGYVLKRLWITADSFWKTANALIYYILFPALMVKSITLADFSATSYDFIGVLVVILLAFVAGIWLLKPLFREAAFWVVFLQGSIRYNSFVFIPVTYLYVGQQVAPIVTLITGFLIMTANIISVHALNMYGVKKQRILHNVKTTLLNPLVFSCLLGLVFNKVATVLPIITQIVWINTTLGYLGDASVVMCLLAIGATLQFNQLGQYYKGIIACVGVKLLLLPAVVVAVLSYMQFPPVLILVCMIYAGSPCSANAVPMTQVMGGDYKNMSLIISIQTVSCLVTLPLLLYGYQWVFSYAG